MEKKDWRDRLLELMSDKEYYIYSGTTYKDIVEDKIEDYIELFDFISSDLDKAREEGYEKGVKDGMKGKVFNKVEIKEEAHIPKKLIDEIWEKGYRAGMADVRKIGEIYKILETEEDGEENTRTK